MQKPLLVVFDFDHTIVDGNTDVIAEELLPSDKITEDIKRLVDEHGWTAYMQEIFLLHQKNGITYSQLRDAIVHIPAVPGITELVQFLHGQNVEIIIVSDSNSLFIRDWLAYTSLTHIFERVFTNPAYLDGDGCLNIELYHLQDFCELSAKNLCKGHILDSYVEERAAVGVTFSQIAYVGDGRNDLCPSLRLSEKDLIFPREGFVLDKLIKDMQNRKDCRLKARVHTWTNGSDIMRDLRLLRLQ